MFVALGLPTQAQQPKKVARIGFLTAASETGISHLTEAFLQGLRDLGYVEGQNISIEYRWADGNFERLPDLVAELVPLKVDVIVATVTQASLAAKNATGTIPIVMVAVGNPVDAGLVAGLAQQGPNITGTSVMNDEVVGKQLALFKETFPKISRVAAMWNPANPVFQKLQLREVESTARGLNVSLQKVEARNGDEIERAFAAIAKERTRALHVIPDQVFTTHRKRIEQQFLAAPRFSPTREEQSGSSRQATRPNSSSSLVGHAIFFGRSICRRTESIGAHRLLRQ